MKGEIKPFAYGIRKFILQKVLKRPAQGWRPSKNPFDFQEGTIAPLIGPLKKR